MNQMIPKKHNEVETLAVNEWLVCAPGTAFLINGRSTHRIVRPHKPIDRNLERRILSDLERSKPFKFNNPVPDAEEVDKCSVSETISSLSKSMVINWWSPRVWLMFGWFVIWHKKEDTKITKSFRDSRAKKKGVVRKLRRLFQMN